MKKTIFELAAGDTTESDVRGSSFTAYANTPVKWTKSIIDAAKKRHFFAQAIEEVIVPPGTKDVVVQYRTKYLGSSDWQTTTTEGAAVTFTKLNNLDGVTLTPVDKGHGVSIGNRSIRTNSINLVKAARDELTYWAGDLVDKAVADAIAGATAATSTTIGAQTIYGGDARAESELEAGDVIEPSMVAEGKKKLRSEVCRYWTPATPAAESISSATKNTWHPDPSDPYLLFISAEQEETFLNDSKFINASEYGTNDIVLNGEIGKYIGTKVIVADNVPSFDTTSSLDGGANAGVSGHRCIMMKPKAAAAIAWGQKPKFYVEKYSRELSTDIIMEMAYDTKIVHNDAIVFIDVADE